MNIQPLEQGNMSTRTYMTLREGLIAGQFRPGQRLVMQTLADQLGTSITPVREACLRLVSERGLELKSGRFVIVPPMTLARYMEVRIIRLSLEGLAAALAAENATQKEIHQLADIQNQFEKADLANNSEEAFRYNREFHFTLYKIAQIEMLIAHIKSLWASMGPMLTVFYKEGERKYIGAAEHHNVLAALQEKNPDRARIAIEQDLILAGEDFLRFLRAHEEFIAS